MVAKNVVAGGSNVNGRARHTGVGVRHPRVRHAGKGAGDETTWADVSLTGRVQKENTMSLTKAEKTERSSAYKDLDDDAMEQKKSEFDAEMAPRVTRSIPRGSSASGWYGGSRTAARRTTR